MFQFVEVSVHTWLGLRQVGMAERHLRGETVHGKSRQESVSSQQPAAAVAAANLPSLSFFCILSINFGIGGSHT